MRYLVSVTVLAIGLLIVGFFVTQAAPAELINYTGTLERGDMTFEDSGEFYDLYEINIKEGQYVDLYLTSDEFDTFLLIVEPDGNEINVDEYYTGDSNAGLLFVVRQTGTYTFYVTSSAVGETGDYEFSCNTYATTLEKTHAGELAEGDEVSWKGGEYFDRYEVTLQPYEKRIVAIESDDFAVYLSIHEPDGFVNFVNGYPAATTLEADETGGTFVLIVTSMESKEVGSYSLEIRSFVEETPD